ncbi:MAG TPA: Trm112 family protein [Verrucomicrobiae bacterium]|jgi:uncharacterized protein YbaR (Trm112 family)|nr:Trm112 family protein [Verrucomicrobiae bacterium]
MIDPDFLKILACPETKQPLSLADDATVAALNAKIQSGALQNRAGQNVSEKVDAALVREDRKYLYPVREDIPIMLIDEAISLDLLR